jgi:hypothetical protein
MQNIESDDKRNRGDKDNSCFEIESGVLIKQINIIKYISYVVLWVSWYNM